MQGGEWKQGEDGRCVRTLLGKMLIKDKGEGAGVGERVFGP